MIVVASYSPVHTQEIINGTLTNVTQEVLPEGFQPPEGIKPMELLPSLIISFIIAVLLLLVLMKFGLNRVLRIWFFLVVIIALGLTLNVIFNKFDFFNSYLIKDTLTYSFFISLIIALPLAFYKIFKRNILIHNITELMIYPGIAAVLVPMFNVTGIVIILILISIYDMWAVWKSKVMIKMAKFQMNEVKIFAGFYIPYIGKKEKQQIELIKSRYKTVKSQEKALKTSKIRVSLAILGGGDVVFPIIASGVMLRSFGFLPALFVVIGALAGLTFLFAISEKKKFYPAMPFITVGIFLGMLASLLI